MRLPLPHWRDAVSVALLPVCFGVLAVRTIKRLHWINQEQYDEWFDQQQALWAERWAEYWTIDNAVVED